MLGLGLSLYKNHMFGLPLDGYKNNLVLGFSYYKLLSSYNGDCVRVRRDSDDTEQDFGFVSNYIDIAGILAFCGAGSGYVSTWYNQYTGGNNAVQATTARQPRIVNTGTFEDNGLYFLTGSSLGLTITTYAAIDILTPKCSFYVNHYTALAQNSFLFGKSTQYSSLYNGVVGVLTYFIRLGDSTNRCVYTLATSTNHKTLFVWNSLNANDLIGNNNGVEILDTKNANISTVASDLTIGSRNGTAYLTGNIKSFTIHNTNVSYSKISQV